MTEFANAKTKVRPNGQDKISVVQADMHNIVEWVKESQQAQETRLNAKLEAIDTKLSNALALLQLIGQHAGMLKDK